MASREGESSKNLEGVWRGTDFDLREKAPYPTLRPRVRGEIGGPLVRSV